MMLNKDLLYFYILCTSVKVLYCDIDQSCLQIALEQVVETYS